MDVLGIGLDLVEVSRIGSLLEKHGARFKERVFGLEEIAYCDAAANPALHYAARFAAKEATVKALGTGFASGVSWQDVQVSKNEAGAPMIALTGKGALVAQELGVSRVLLSLTHTKETAAASVVLVG